MVPTIQAESRVTPDLLPHSITAVKPLMESVVVYWRLGGDERFLRWNYASHGNE